MRSSLLSFMLFLVAAMSFTAVNAHPLAQNGNSDPDLAASSVNSDIACPTSNGTVHTYTLDFPPRTVVFQVHCSTDTSDAPFTWKYVNGFDVCMEICVSFCGCVAVTYNDNKCYFHENIGTLKPADQINATSMAIAQQPITRCSTVGSEAD